VIDIFKLEAEIKKVENELPELKGIKERLYLAHNAHLILDFHIKEDMKENDTIGTTKCGIGPCYIDKVNRTGMRVQGNEDILCKLKYKTINIYEHFCIENKNKKSNHVLFEGAQGFQLDIDWGDYPYVTSSVVNYYGIYTCGIPKIKIKDIIGCAKLYDTYVGSKEFQIKDNKMLALIASYGNEKGATTGRKRQTNWLNLDEIEKAININNCNYVVFNKCDVLNQIGLLYKDEKVFNLIVNNEVKNFPNIVLMQEYVYYYIRSINKQMNILFSNSPEYV